MSFFEDLAERYEDFMLDLEDRGIPNPRVLVPALAAIAVIAIAFAVWTLAITPGVATAEMKVFVYDPEEKPLANASVSLYLEEELLKTATTAENGSASFAVAPGNYRVVVSAPGYKTSSKESLPAMLEFTLEREAVAVKARLGFAVKDKDGVPVVNALVKISYDGTTISSWTGSNGVASLELPASPEHATVAVEKAGYASETKDYSKELLLQSATAPLEITLYLSDSPNTTSPTYQRKGTLVVDVSSEGNRVGDALVTLIDAATSSMYASAKTGQDGLASIENVDYGKSFYINVEGPSKMYQPSYSSRAFLFTPQTPMAVVSLQPTNPGAVASLRIAVKTRAGEPLAESEVFVFDAASNALIKRATTGDTGMALFEDLSAKLIYYATAWHEGFLPAYIATVRAGDSKTVALEEEATGNYGTVAASVAQIPAEAVEEVPVENAEVALFVRGGAVSGRFLGVPPALTASDGSATFNIPLKIDGKTYSVFARASKESLAGESDAVQAGGDVQLKILVSPPTAKIVAKVKDATDETALAGAVVTAKTGGASAASCITSEKGNCTLEVPPSDKIKVAVKLAGYLDATAVAATASKDRRVVELALYPTAKVNAAQARFLGFYDRRGKVLELAPGSVYAAKFEVVAPAATERVGLYVRVGRATSTEEDFAFIRDWDVSPLQYSGATYDAAQPCAEENFTTKERKWVELVWPRGFSGSRTVAVNVFVKPTAMPEEKLELAYRAYALQSNVVSLAPVDAELAVKLSTELAAGGNVTRGELCRAKEARQSAAVSQQAMTCSDSVCHRFWFEDVETKAVGGDGFSAVLGKELIIHYEVYSDVAIEKLGVKSPYLKILSVEPELASFAAESDFERGGKEQAFDVDIKAKVKARGKIHAIPVLPGQHAVLKILMHPIRAMPVAEATHWITVGGAGAPVVKVSPQQVDVVFGAEQRVISITVEDKDGRPIEDASITIFDGDNTPLEGREVNVVGDGSSGNGEDGKYRILVSPRKLGTLGLRVFREGFRKYENYNTIEVVPAGWFEVEPTQLTAFTDNTKAEKQIITLRSFIDSKATVSVNSRCYMADGTMKSGESILHIAPRSLKVDNSRERFVETWVKENVTAKASCTITFVARISPSQAAEQSVVFDVDTKNPYVYKEEKVKCVPLSAYLILIVNEYGIYESPALCLQYAGVTVTNVEVRGPPEYLGFVSATPVPAEGYFYVNAYLGDTRFVDEEAASARLFLHVTLATGRLVIMPLFIKKISLGRIVFKEFRYGLPESITIEVDPATLKGSGVVKSEKDELLLPQAVETAYCKVKEKITTTPSGKQEGLTAFHISCDVSSEASKIDREGIASLQDSLTVHVVRAFKAFNVGVGFSFNSAKATSITNALKTRVAELNLYEGTSATATLYASDLGNYGERYHEWDSMNEQEFKDLGLKVKQEEKGKFVVDVQTTLENRVKLKEKLENTGPFQIWFDGSPYQITVKLSFKGEEPEIVRSFLVNGSPSAMPKDYVRHDAGDVLNVSYEVNVSQLVRKYSSSFKSGDRGGARLAVKCTKNVGNSPCRVGEAFNLTNEALPFGREEINFTQVMWNVTRWNEKNGFEGLPDGEYKLLLNLENSGGVTLHFKEWNGVIRVGKVEKAPALKKVPPQQQPLPGTTAPSKKTVNLAKRIQHIWVSDKEFRIRANRDSRPKTIITELKTNNRVNEIDRKPRLFGQENSIFVGVQLCPKSLKDGGIDDANVEATLKKLDDGTATVILTDKNGKEQYIFEEKIKIKLHKNENRIRNEGGEGKEFKLANVNPGVYYLKVNVTSKASNKEKGELVASGWWGHRSKPSGNWSIKIFRFVKSG